MARRLEAETRRNRPVARAQGEFPPARLGHLAPALLGLPDPGHPLRRLRRGAGAARTSCRSCCPRTSPSTCPAIRSTGTRPGSTSPARNAAASRPARDRHHGHVRGFVLVFRALHRPVADRPADRPPDRRPLAAGRPVYRRHRARDPAPALFALLHPRHDGTPAMPGLDEPFAGLFTQGMVVHETYRAPDGILGDAGRGPHRERGRRAPRRPRRRPASRSRSARSRRCRSRSGTPSTRTTSSRSYGADTARWFMLSDSPPERDVIWTEEGVQGAARFVQRVWRLVAEIAGAHGRAGRRRAPAGPARRHGGPQGGPPGARRGRARTSSGLRFNRCVAHIYELANALQDLLARPPRDRREPGFAEALREAGRIFVQMLAPMMPHLAEECWQALGRDGLVAESAMAGGRPVAPGRGRDHPARAGERQEAGRRDGGPGRRPGRDRGGRALARSRAAGYGRQAAAQDHRRAAEDRECRRLMLARPGQFVPPRTTRASAPDRRAHCRDCAAWPDRRWLLP